MKPMRTYEKRNSRGSTRSWWAGPAACLVTMLALPASANIDIPNDPLTTGSRVAPNILFILDDSGSMAYRHMYSQSITRITGDGVDSGPTGRAAANNTNTTTATSVNAIYDQSYVTNSIYYNPAVNYQAWVQANGSRMTGGLNYAAAYSNEQQASGSVNLGSNTHVFYVPKGGDVDLTQISSYYRYELQSDSAGGQIIQSEWGQAERLSASLGAWRDSSQKGLKQLGYVDVPAGVSTLTFRSDGGSYDAVGLILGTVRAGEGNGADLYVRRGSMPSVSTGDACGVGRGNQHECTFANPQAGRWYVALNAPEVTLGIFQFQSRYSNVQVNVEESRTTGCDGRANGRGWVNCEPRSPAGRTVAEERANFAAWYSYHRTRMKAAKAGAGEAFAGQDSTVRVGFRTIWDRNNLDIPVNDGNEGLFVDNEANTATGAKKTTARSDWYARLYGASGTGGTPLRDALYSAGEYFSEKGGSGPYGPQGGANQYSCRQNFAILTTDGYWNSGSPGLKNEDNLDGEVITGPNNQRYQYKPVAPYRDGYSDTLADVAMRFWKNDLRPDMTNNVPTSNANPAFWQHMVTFGISIGLSGTRGWSSVAEVPDNASWPEPKNDSPNNIDDLLHAAVNGRGAFVAASNPSEFARGLDEALNAIAQRTSSFSNVATNSVSLDTGTRVFNASYVSGIWTGQVTARAIGPTGVSSDIAWTSTLPRWDARSIYTREADGGAVFPTPTQIKELARGDGVANFAVSGEDNAKYIRGERRLESDAGNNGRLRNRSSILGDIIGSSPAYVADTDTLYVGANDGMLHAFNAKNGQELFAYVPGLISMQTLASISRPDYAHRYFVDGPVVVSPRTLTTGKNLLVGTLGRGGKGVYSLDVSTPATFDADDVKWENAEGELMGHVLGEPILAPVRTTANATAPAVVLGNGVNSTSNRAALIILDLDSGEVIRELDTKIGSAEAPNGLSAPTGVYAEDGRTLAYVYAGDLRGNIWKFDLTNADSDNWSVGRLFTAVDDTGRAQPISGAVAVATNPTTRDRWVFFGTGRYLTVEDADPRHATPQSMYGFIEGTTAPTRLNLEPRVVEVTGEERNGYPVRGFQQAERLPSGRRGWYIDLPGDGERIIQDAQVVSSFLVTASMLPTGDACEADGTGFINALDAFTGTSARGSYFDIGSKPGEPVSLGGDRAIPVGSVNTGVGMPTLPNLLRGQAVSGGTSGTGPRSVGTLRPRWDRMSWREVRQD